MSYSLKDYKNDIDNLHDTTSNSVIDLFQKRNTTDDEDMKVVYDAMIDFYMKLKQAMDTTMEAMERSVNVLKNANKSQ